jgi:hypothetical protein
MRHLGLPWLAAAVAACEGEAPRDSNPMAAGLVLEPTTVVGTRYRFEAPDDGVWVAEIDADGARSTLMTRNELDPVTGRSTRRASRVTLPGWVEVGGVADRGFTLDMEDTADCDDARDAPRPTVTLHPRPEPAGQVLRVVLHPAHAGLERVAGEHLIADASAWLEPSVMLVGGRGGTLDLPGDIDVIAHHAAALDATHGAEHAAGTVHVIVADCLRLTDGFATGCDATATTAGHAAQRIHGFAPTIPGGLAPPDFSGLVWVSADRCAPIGDRPPTPPARLAARIAHELGHHLGLSHVDPDEPGLEGNLMAPTPPMTRTTDPLTPAQRARMATHPALRSD